MIEIAAFRGIRYNKALVGDLNKVHTPPYDKITEKLQSELYDRSPYNFVRLNKGRESDRYESASNYLEEWLSSGVLIQDDEPCIYIYNQEYKFGSEDMRLRRGFIALLRLDEFSNGNVLPHEYTLKGPKVDRLSLLEKTEATFGQIFMLFSDKGGGVFSLLSSVESEPAIISVYDDNGNKHRVWKVADDSIISVLKETMRDKMLYIADGHHRYETSLNYRNNIKKRLGKNYKKDALSEYIMCTFVDMDDRQGISILPTHRFVRGLSNFEPDSFLSSLDKAFIMKAFSSLTSLELELSKSRSAFGLILYRRDREESLCLITFKQDASYFPDSYSADLRSLDLSILHKVVLENILGIDEDKLASQSNIDYFRSKEQAISLLREGKYQLGFLLNPTKMEEVKRVTESGEKMPQKSTDFYPKLLSGLLVFSIKESIER